MARIDRARAASVLDRVMRAHAKIGFDYAAGEELRCRSSEQRQRERCDTLLGFEDVPVTWVGLLRGRKARETLANGYKAFPCKTCGVFNVFERLERGRGNGERAL